MSDWQEQASANQFDNAFIDDLKQRVLMRHDTAEASDRFSATPSPTPIDQKLEDERNNRQRLAVEAAERQQKLKEAALKKLFRFLATEAALLLALIFLQGFGRLWRWHFRLDTLSFRFVVGLALGQLALMAVVGLRQLFPNRG